MKVIVKYIFSHLPIKQQIEEWRKHNLEFAKWKKDPIDEKLHYRIKDFLDYNFTLDKLCELYEEAEISKNDFRKLKQGITVCDYNAIEQIYRLYLRFIDKLIKEYLEFLRLFSFSREELFELQHLTGVMIY